MANEVRTGLEEVVDTTPRNVAVKKVHPLDEQWMGKPVRQHIREFGAIFGVIFLSIGAFKLYKGDSSVAPYLWTLAGGLVAALGYYVPSVLRPLWRGWMKLAHYLSIVMTFVILSVAWTIGFLPMAYLLRVLGIKRIDTSYKTKAATYWETRDAKYDDFKRLELQF